jgi:hypothetical protein
MNRKIDVNKKNNFSENLQFKKNKLYLCKSSLTEQLIKKGGANWRNETLATL